MEQLISLVTEAAVAVLASGLVAVVGFALRWFNMQLSKQQEERLKGAAILAVGFAEEKSRQWLKSQGEKLAGAVIEQVAVDRLLDQLPNVSAAEARQIILSVLPYARAGLDAGATSLGNAMRTPEAIAPTSDPSSLQ
jgi:hypothetical protein